MLDLEMPLAGFAIPACGLHPVVQLDVLVAMILVACVFDVLLDLVAARIEVFPIGLELESVRIAARGVNCLPEKQRETFKELTDEREYHRQLLDTRSRT